MRAGVFVEFHDSESITEPQEFILKRLLQLNAREFLQQVAAQSMNVHRLIRVGHRHERVAAVRRGETHVLVVHVDAVDERDARPAVDTEQFHVRRVPLADEHSRVTQRAANRCLLVGLHSMHLVPRGPVTFVAAHQSENPRETVGIRADEQSVRVAHVAHAEHSQIVVHVARIADMQTGRDEGVVQAVHEKELLVRRVVGHH